MNNRNVYAALFFSFTISLSETSWGYSALSGYLFDVGHSNAKVGLAEGFQGMSQLVAAIVAGIIADKVNRRKPIRVGMIIGFCAMISLWVGMFAPLSTKDDTNSYWMAAFGLTMWGCFRGVTLAPVDALFADSVATSKRAKFQVWRFVATLSGATAGPLGAVILFRYFGDTWTRNELRTVIAIGTVFGVVPLASLMLFHDKYSLDEQSSGVVTNDLDDKHSEKSHRIRLLCFGADLLSSFASGMTIKFFPLFFKNNTHLSPGDVNTITVATTLSMIVGSLVGQRAAKRFGRVPVIVFFKIAGIILLFIMALKKDYWEHWEIIVPIYVVRTLFMNSTAPLQKSILMDYTVKSQRARWSAMDSIVVFGWSGSAFVGGVLADKYGFGYTFLITAVMQTSGLLCHVALLGLVDDCAANNSTATIHPAPASVATAVESLATVDEEEVETEEYRLMTDDDRV